MSRDSTTPVRHPGHVRHNKNTVRVLPLLRASAAQFSPSPWRRSPRLHGGSIQRMGGGERERRDDGVELLAVRRNHLVGAVHRADGGPKRTIAGVFEEAAGIERRLFADDSWAVHMLHVAIGVADDPLPGDELRAAVAFVRDSDPIGEQILPVARGALLSQVLAVHLNPDAPSCRITHSEIDYAMRSRQGAGCDILCMMRHL